MEKGKLIDKNTLIEIFKKHFSDTDPDGEIHKELKLLILNGYDRDDIKKKVEAYLFEFQSKDGPETKEEEIVYNVMSFFVGWCAPDWKL